MSRRHYLVTYDVADDKRRREIFEALLDYGNHTQFSVFLCELSDCDLQRLRARLLEAVHTREDQVLIVDLGLAHHPLDQSIDSIGKAFRPPQRCFIV